MTTPTPAFKVYYTRNSRNLRRERVETVETVLAATPEDARVEFNRNINQEFDPVITAVIPVYFNHEAGRYMTVPEAV